MKSLLSVGGFFCIKYTISVGKNEVCDRQITSFLKKSYEKKERLVMVKREDYSKQKDRGKEGNV